MQNLTFSLIQVDQIWEDKTANLKKFEHLIDFEVNKNTDVIVLPEMFTTAFSMTPALLAEAPDGDTFQWMKKKSAEKNMVICGSLIIVENGLYYNRFYWVQPDGIFFNYNKKHLFTMAGEHLQYSTGNTRTIIEYKGFRICPMICFDLRFPAWNRNTDDYDILLLVANWPERRIEHWNPLIIARAIENQAYVVAVNRVGKDGNGMNHNGHSMVVDPLGKIISFAANTETIIFTSVSKQLIETTRQNLPFLKERDNFTFDS